MLNLNILRFPRYTRFRYISSHCVLMNLSRQGRIMNKLMNVKAKSKKKWYEPPENTLPTITNLSKTTHIVGKSGLRRMAMLNKMFMKNISDLLCTGSLSRDILGKGLEISKVSITPNFHTLRVYWICSRKEHSDEMDRLLNRTAGLLRHELSQLRLMGEVPTIVFVKDEHLARLNEIDNMLTIADYGEDYEPKIIGHLLKADFTLNSTLSPDIVQKIHQLESESVDADEEPLPEMTHSVYGLDHLAMMNRMRGARKTNEDAWQQARDPGVRRWDNVVSYRSDGSDQAPSFDGDRKTLSDFLLKRQIEQDRLHKLALRRDDERRVVFELQEDEQEDYYDDVEEYVDDDDHDLEDDTSATR